MKKHKQSICILRRDLRLEDNGALLAACEHSEEVQVWFFLDPRQVGKDNPYKSEKAISFMATSLLEVHEALERRGAQLNLFEGQADKALKTILKVENPDAVYVNADYTPFSIERDKVLEALTKESGAEWISIHDALLTTPGSILTGEGTPYKVYSAFQRKAAEVPVAKPYPNKFSNVAVSTESVQTATILKDLILNNDSLFRRGGREEALAILRSFTDFRLYTKERDFPAIKGTTGLSAHHKFGTISIRETYYAAKEAGLPGQFIKELYWRDFFTHLAFHFPRVFNENFQEDTEKVEWRNNKEEFQAWKEGRTGFPIVDAGMRQLNETGYMHNRVRMIVASFLTKDLQIHWKWGEQYFAQQLLDYDPAVNNGSWQWAASTGADAQPYFRIFNPWLQSKKFDKNAEYIKEWIPELAQVSATRIHTWYKDKPSLLDEKIDYPAPIVDHAERSRETKLRFQKAKG